MNRLVRSVLLLAGLALTPGCPQDKPTIRIGAIYALTGANGTAGNNQFDAAVAALEEINRAGGVLGRQLEIHVRDDGSTTTRAADAAHDLIENVGVKAILGSNPSGNTVAIAGVAAPAKVVQISSGSVSSEITTLLDDGYLFRTVPSDVYQYRLQARRAYDKGFRRAAILHVPGLQGTTPAAAFERAFTGLGGTITTRAQWVANQTSYRDYLNTVLATNPEVCTLIGPVTDSAYVIRDYVDSFITRGIFWFFMNAQNQDFVTGAGGNFSFQHEGTRPTVKAGNDRFPWFRDSYFGLYNREPNNFGESNAFDAMYLLALAMEAAGEEGLTNTQLIRDQMIAVSRGGTPYGPREYAAARAAAAAGEDLDYQGASGDVDFDANGDVLGGFDIWQVQNGVEVNILTDIPPPP